MGNHRFLITDITHADVSLMIGFMFAASGGSACKCDSIEIHRSHKF